MKQFKKGLSLILALALLLSVVYLAPADHVHAAASDYIATSYAANLSVMTTQTVSLMQYPTASSTAKYTLPANTMLTVKALHKNTSGTYWYEVLYYNMTLYIDATATTMVDHLTGDVTITGVQSPASLTYGSAFPIKGDITSTLNDLGTITASMYTSSNITKEPALTSSDNAGGKSYSLYSSTVDYNLAFNSLSPGVYTYVVTAEAISYYIDDNDTLATSAQTVVLETQECVITDWTNPNKALAFGVDVSVWNGTINWASAKNDIDYAILRIGYEYTMDTQFLNNVNGCVNNGIPYGVYIYSYAETEAEAIAEANFVVNTLETYGLDPDLPIWFDFEDECQMSLSSSTMNAIVKGFCKTVSDAGYQPGIYTFKWIMTSYLTDSYFDSVPIWIAQVDGYSSNGTSTYTGGLWQWQYSWEGVISGMTGAVDCNYYYAELPGTTSDTSYLASCTYYPSNLTVKTSSSTTMRQYPSTSYSALASIPSGTSLRVTGLYKNTSGEYWYQVVSDGTTGYIPASSAAVTEYLYNDLAVIDPAMASNLSVGSGYYISGNIVSQYNNIYTAYANIYSGENTLATPVLSSSYSPNAKEYDLYASEVDYALPFNQLDTGYYTYEISADVRNYYVSSGALQYASENVVVWTAPFTVGSASITPPTTVSCSHSIVTDAAVAATCTTTGLTEGSHCSKCGVVFTAQTVVPALGHSWSVTSDEANCQNYELFHYSCSRCGSSYDIPADALSEWSETKPLGVDESLIESKTQYRYADCTSTSWQETDTSTIYYVPSWPSGFDTTSSIYTQYNKAGSKVTASETTTSKTVINSDALVGYLYYHWCSSTDTNHYSYAAKSSTHTIFHAYYSTTEPSSYTCDTSDMSYKTSDSTCSAGNSAWFFVTEVYGQNYTTSKKVSDGKEWGSWSAWSDTVYTAVTNSRKVETRTVYRYVNAQLGGHNYVNGVCSVCGAADPNVSPFTLAGANMVLGGILEMNFFINQTDISGTGYYAVITHYAANGTRTVTVPYSEWGTYGPYYMVTLEDLEARQMADKIEVVIYKTDGTKASETWTDSVRDYTMRTYAARNEEGKTLLVDMLNYGAAAQTFFGYNATDLANNQLTAAQQAYATSSVSCTDQRTYGSNYVGSALVLESRIILTVLFQDLTTDMYAIVSYTDHYGESKTIRVEGSDFVSYYSYYGIQVDDLVVADGNQLVTVTICNANGTPVAWASDSMNSYAARNLSKDSIYEMVAKFTASAYAYFH